MAPKDIFHDAVRRALEKEGWRIIPIRNSQFAMTLADSLTQLKKLDTARLSRFTSVSDFS